MHPVISWILFLGISGAAYIIFKGVPYWILEDKIGSDKVEASLLGKKVRKKKRVERVQQQQQETTKGISTIVSTISTPLESQKSQSIYTETISLESIPKTPTTSLVQVPSSIVSVQTTSFSNTPQVLSLSKVSNNTSDASVRGTTSKLTSENDHGKTKKQKQNAVKREKQKLLKARMEEERLNKLREHQRMLEDERLKAQIRKAEQNLHTRHPRSPSGEWTLVTSKERRHVTPVFASVP